MQKTDKTFTTYFQDDHQTSNVCIHYHLANKYETWTWGPHATGVFQTENHHFQVSCWFLGECIYIYIWIDVNVPPVTFFYSKGDLLGLQSFKWYCGTFSWQLIIPHLQSPWSKVIFFRLSPKMWIALIIVKWQGVLFAETKKGGFQNNSGIHKMTFL